jgi:hypothetical protein
MSRRHPLFHDGLKVEYIKGLAGIFNKLIQVARRPRQRIGRPGCRSLRESRHSSMRQQRASGKELQEATPAGDLMEPRQHLAFSRPGREVDPRHSAH